MFSTKTKVILDTNILLLPAEGIDIFTALQDTMNEPYTLCTYTIIMQELKKLMAGKKKESFAAKLGYILAKQKALKILTSSSNLHADDVIVEKTTKKMIVATQDKELIKRLKDKGVRVLRYQQRAFIFQ